MTIPFEKRLAELDAYLQMLIQESEILERKIGSSSSEVERDSLLVVRTNLEYLIGSIKHSIVLLQIAKVSIKTSSSSLSSITQEVDSTSLDTDAGIGAQSSEVSRDQIAIADQASSPQAPARSTRRQQRRLHGNLVTTIPPPAQLLPRNVQSTRKVLRDIPGQKTLLPSAHQQPNLQSSSLEENHNNSDITATHSCNSRAEEKSIRSPQNQVNSSIINKFTEISLSATDGRLKDGATICSTELDEDDDDAFYDAPDEYTQQQETITEIKTSNLSIPSLQKQTGTPKTSVGGNNYLDTKNSAMSGANNDNKLTTLTDGSIDWDNLYEEDEEDLGSLENHGSVIKHLMAQIRIGMDLTKVVLPTFILERRSLLEMYADFFAHPDLFSSIPDFETPEDRMVQIVRWYLSAFHAGRKSSVAKKPYNPILGEIFLCHWNLDQETGSDNDKISNISQSKEPNEVSVKIAEIERSNSTESTASVSDIERFSEKLPQNSLLFVAEQVSHHPPVSAFYAENPEKLISCCAHIYTKSKYLGLSVGVHNIGEGVIDVLKHNETYVCTFPSAYGRSILTVPWVELGGSVTITCKQTGYSANIDFVTKPFYGGKKHRVMGEILRPNKEPFLTIDGEWNGSMYSKTPMDRSDKQIFVNTACLPVIKKKVRSIGSQESFESRNVWKEVTRALKLHDVTGATAAKSFIEQRQRDLLKDRMEKGIKWKTRYFEAADEGWKYTKPLSKRLPVNIESKQNL